MSFAAPAVELDVNETLTCYFYTTNLLRQGHLLVDSLAGVARCRKCIDSAQRLAQAGQKSAVECKGKSQLDSVSEYKKR